MDDFVFNVARLSAFPARVQTLVASLTVAQCTFRRQDSDWSILEHIGHLIDIDRMYMERIALICTKEYQPFALFSIDGIHQQGNYNAQSINTLIALLRTTRHTTVTALHALTAHDIVRIGIDSYFGEITLARLIEILANHEDEHYDAMCHIITHVATSAAASDT